MADYLGCPAAGDDTIVEVRRLDRYAAPGDPITPPRLDGYFRLAGVERVTWGRTYNSWAPFEIALGGGSFCQNVLQRIQPGWWEVRIRRGSELAYSGPIWDITQVSGRAGAVISGGDMASVFHEDAGRLINLVDMQYNNVDPVNIAADVIRRMMGLSVPRDIHLIEDYLYTNTVGETIDFEPGVTADYVGDTLDDLTEFGLLYAAVGRRIILSSPADISRRPVGTLTTAHFQGDATVVQSARDMGILGVAVGETNDGDPVVTTAGEFGSQWGWPAVRVDVPRGTSSRSRANAARRAIQGRTRPMWRVDLPRSARLLPTAPIGLRDLRPGSARVDIEIHNIPVPIRQPAMLTEVEFEYVPGSPGRETVRATFAAIGDPVAIP